MIFSKFKKVLTGVVAVSIFASYTLGVSAAVASSSGNGTSTGSSLIDETIERLSDIKWDAYYAQYATMPRYDGNPIVINAADYSDFEYPAGYDETSTSYPLEIKNNIDGKQMVLQTPDIGTTSWKVTVPKSGLYAIDLLYYPTEAKSANIERTLRINGKVEFGELRNLLLTKIWHDEYQYDENGNIVFEKDDIGNESRPNKTQTPEWRNYTVSDPTGYYNGEFLFYLEEGENVISLEAQKEPMALASITLRAPKDELTYEEYIKAHEAMGHTKAPSDSIIYLEGEKPSATSDITLYPSNDRTSPLTSPSDAGKTLLNSIGGSNWATLGQWIEWSFEVPEGKAGLYTFNFRFSQSENEGIFVSRRFRVDGEVPFEEANNLQFMYSSKWQVTSINDGSHDYFEIYLDEGKHTISLEVSLGNIRGIVSEVSSCLTEINNIYIDILKITGPNPDRYTSYNFYKRIPDDIAEMRELSQRLYAVANEFVEVSGVTSSNTATLENVARILEKMASNSETEVAKNFSALKTYIGTLGTWLNNIQKQALTIDYIQIQPAGEELPRAEANFFQNAWFEIKSFFYSFVRDNSSFASEVEGEDIVKIDVWTTVSREYAQIIRDLVDDSFTKSYPNISVNLKLVAGGTLLPATLAGDGPDVMMGVGSTDVMNYAVRGALLDLTVYDEFEDVKSRFLDAAMIPLTVAVGSPDGPISVFGIPQTMSFSVMFYRQDIFADLGISVPTTWDEFKTIVPRLQSNSYTVGMSKDTNMFIYQNGGTLYKDNGTKIAYDTDIALDAFTTMCEFFTLYRFPITYDSANRFRTGEIPLLIADYIGFYNQFTVFATELKGLWSFSNVPGTVKEDGSIDCSHTLAVSAMVLMKDAKKRGTDAAAFKFIEWWTRAGIQGQYANELIALLGPAGKYATANVEAFNEMSWTASELRILSDVFDHLVGIPEMPGSYIISRYVNFAFLAAYNNGATPSDELLSYVPLINKEFERKREELNREFYIPASSNA